MDTNTAAAVVFVAIFCCIAIGAVCVTVGAIINGRRDHELAKTKEENYHKRQLEKIRLNAANEVELQWRQQMKDVEKQKGEKANG